MKGSRAQCAVLESDYKMVHVKCLADWAPTGHLDKWNLITYHLPDPLLGKGTEMGQPHSPFFKPPGSFPFLHSQLLDLIPKDRPKTIWEVSRFQAFRSLGHSGLQCI